MALQSFPLAFQVTGNPCDGLFFKPRFGYSHKRVLLGFLCVERILYFISLGFLPFLSDIDAVFGLGFEVFSKGLGFCQTQFRIGVDSRFLAFVVADIITNFCSPKRLRLWVP